VGNICTRKDGHNAFVSAGCRVVNANDFGVGVRRAHDVGIRHADEFNIVGVFAFACEEAAVFDALHGLTYITHLSFFEMMNYE
jgi:hypothetical protein